MGTWGKRASETRSVWKSRRDLAFPFLFVFETRSHVTNSNYAADGDLELLDPPASPGTPRGGTAGVRHHARFMRC